MCKTLDIEGKTLAELRTLNVRFEREQAAELSALRTLNVRFEREQAAELSALRTEYQTMQRDFVLRKETDEAEIEGKFTELWDRYHDDIEPLDDEYRRLGVVIGTLMDKRHNADESEYDAFRQQIEAAMDRRREIKRQQEEAQPQPEEQ